MFGGGRSFEKTTLRLILAYLVCQTLFDFGQNVSIRGVGRKGESGKRVSLCTLICIKYICLYYILDVRSIYDLRSYKYSNRSKPMF